MLAFVATALWQENSGALFILSGMPKETFIGKRRKNGNSPFSWIGVAFTDNCAISLKIEL
jgi:hypothetical protein